MITSAIPGTSATPPTQAQPAAGNTHGFSFHDFLSAINPLQYLPVVGTIYRALTGDVIPEALRVAGSMLVSGLLGGPIGLAMSIGATIGEKVTGLDPEKIVATALHRGPPAADVPAQVAAAPAETLEPAPASTILTQPTLTPQQLEAYGVRSSPSGGVKLPDADGADILNGMELVRLGKLAAAAYAANQPRQLTVASASGPATGLATQ